MPEKQDPAIAAERAAEELRRQRGLLIRDTNGYAVGNFPAECLTEHVLAVPGLRLLITGARAQALGLPEQDTKIDAGSLSLAQIMAIADPLADASALPALVPISASEIDSMALSLAKHADLLPALLLVPEGPATQGWQELSVADLAAALKSPRIELLETARARLPVEGAEDSRIVSFRTRGSASTHLALIVGTPESVESPLARVHSSCFTGDILGSLRCDCGDQLRLALQAIVREGCGILVYLHQEGRGIGITNKLRAYRLQERGCDTYEANRLLGFGEDERDFTLAAAILKTLGITTVRLLTNNPHKLATIEKAGITVSARVPLVAESGAHNHGYMDTKALKAGHLF